MVAVSGIEPDPSEGMSLACSRYTSPHYASVVTRSEAQRSRGRVWRRSHTTNTLRVTRKDNVRIG